MNSILSTLLRRVAHRPQLLKIIENIGWLFFDKVLRLGVGLIVGVWVARYLGPEQFGLLSFAGAYVSLYSTFAILGLQEIVVRDLVREPDGARETLGTAAALQLIGGLFAYGLIVTSIYFLRPDDPQARLVVTILGSIMCFNVFEGAAYWFESQVQSKYMVWVRNVVFLIFAMVKVALILMDASLAAFAWAMVAEGALAAVCLVVIFTWRVPSLRKLVVRMKRAVSLLRDSWALIFAGLAVMIYMKIDQIMLGQMLGDEAVGIYSAAVRISEIWYFVPMVVVASVFPAILQTKQSNEHLYYERLQKLYDLMVIMSLGVAIPMTFLADPLVIFLFGSEYSASGTVLSIHIWASLFVFLGVASGKWMLAENRQILSLQRASLGAILNIVLNFFIIPRFGINGAAWTSVFSYSVAGFVFDVFQQETKKMFSMKLASLNIYKAFKRLI